MKHPPFNMKKTIVHSGSIAITPPSAKRPPGVPDLRKLSAEEITTCQAIGYRATQLAKQFSMGQKIPDPILEQHPDTIAMDVAFTHHARNLKLREFLDAPLLEFWAEYVAIQKNINRACPIFPGDVKLRFAQSGAIYSKQGF